MDGACFRLLFFYGSGDPNGIRTRAAAVKGRCPRPLNDGAMPDYRRATEGQAYGRWVGNTNPAGD